MFTIAKQGRNETWAASNEKIIGVIY